jgi:putative colanic acid biosynthesis acetyltransferase WcaB
MNEEHALDSSMRRWVLQDWRANAGCRDAQLVAAFARSAQWAHRRGGRAGRWFCTAYGLVCSLILKVDLPPEARIGPRLRIFHPAGIVLHPDVVVGADCTLRHNVTLGNVVRRDGSSKGTPRIGDRVELGAGCAVLGDVEIGDDARIGALALVLTDVPAGATAVGNPARIVRTDESAWPTKNLSMTKEVT